MRKHISLYVIMIFIFGTLFLISIMFFSLKNYMLANALSKENNYHIKIITDDFNYADMSSIKKFWKSDNTYNIVFNNINEITSETHKICNKVECKKIIYNQKLMKMYDNFSNLSSPIIKSFIYILLIISGLFFLILKNTFNIIYYKNVKELATLNALGMTKWEMIIFFLKRFSKVFIISLILAIVLRTLLSYIILYFIKQLLDIKSFHLYFNLIGFLIASIFVIFIFVFSMLLSILKINKNLIYNINNSNNIKYKKVSFKSNPSSYLAHINYKRNKKRGKLFTLTVFTSMSLFILVNISIIYMNDAVRGYITNLKYDAIIKTDIKENSLSLLNQFVKSNEKIEKYSLFRTCSLVMDIPINNYTDKKYYNKNKEIVLIGSDRDLVINKTLVLEKYKKEYRQYLKKFNFNNKNIKLTNNIPFGLDAYISSSNIVMLKGNIKKWCPNYETVLIIKGENLNIKKSLIDFKKKHKDISFEYIDYTKPKVMLKNILLFTKIITFIFSFLILFIGIISFISSLYANLERRKKEMFILKSIGASNKVLKDAVLKENLIILYKGGFWAIAFTLIINNYLYNKLIEYFSIKYYNPIFLIIICLLLIYLVMYIILCKIYTSDEK